MSGTYAPLEMAADTRPVARTGRYAPFGAIRLLLALLVLIQHASAHTAPPGYKTALMPYEPGSIAVFIFFVLSGYIIAEAGDVIYPGRPFAFIVNRALRIIPTYLVGLAVFVFAAATLFHFNLGAIPVEDHPLAVEDLTSFSFYIANVIAVFPISGIRYLANEMPIVIPIIWAVRIEIMFYLVYFLAMLLARWSGQPLNRVLTLFGIGLIAFTALRFSATQHSSLEHIPFFILGVAAQRAINTPPAWNSRFLVPLSFAIVSFAACLMRLAAQDAILAKTEIPRAIGPEIGIFLALVALCLAATLFRLRSGSTLARIDQRLGELTYPLYINQVTVILVFAQIYSPPTVSLMFLSMAVSIGAAWFIAALTEPHIAALRDLVRGKRLRA